MPHPVRTPAGKGWPDAVISIVAWGLLEYRDRESGYTFLRVPQFPENLADTLNKAFPCIQFGSPPKLDAMISMGLS